MDGHDEQVVPVKGPEVATGNKRGDKKTEVTVHVCVHSFQ